jgi:3-hydroxy-5-methyl-1-naphthoate 3-O-methyltransferase
MKPMQALNRLNEIAASFMVTQTFSTACNLGVFEELSRGPTTADELARKLSVHPNACRRLLVALKQLGLVDRANDRYRNSELGDFLTSKSAVPLEPLSMWGSPWPHMWEFLLDALREFSPRWQQALGTTAEETFAALYEDPVRLRRFCQLMDAFSLPIGQEIAERFDFTPHRCVMDVAGGPGGLATQIGRKYLHLRGIIMDLPPVCRVAEERIAANGLSDRFTTRTADLLTGPYPLGADAITLSWILHDWGDENCRKILRNCFEALPSKGVLLISEIVLNNDLSGTQFGVLMSLHMLVVCEPGAKERSEDEYRSLLEEAGFRNVEVIRFDAPRDLIIGRKP